jgi:hypothetical protein
MEVFQELKLKPTTPESIDLLFKKINEKSVSSGWVVKNDFVDNYKKNLGEQNKKVICVMSPKIFVSNKEIQAYVWLGEWKTTLEVFNIVPVKTGSLSYSEYNNILKQFFDFFISPELNNLRFELIYTESNKTIEDLASSEVAKALKQFSGAANKTTGHSHPMDSERWLYFICLAHREKTNLDVEELVRWLKEEGDWEDSKAWELGLDYEYSMDLLKYYDTNFISNNYKD